MSTKEKQSIIEEIKIPENVNFEIIGSMMKISGPVGENEFPFKHPRVSIKKEDGKIVLRSNGKKRNQKKIIMSLKSHLKNMVDGVIKNYTYKLKICSGHFPMTVSVLNNKVIIKNFFAEKIPRQANILSKVNVKIDHDLITVSGANKENVGQTAANLEQACRITNKDRRVFMDGIYIISKGEEE